MYIVFNSTDDGVHVCTVSHEELLVRITPDSDGNTWYGGSRPILFLESIPDTADIDGWPEGVLIVKGDIIVPKPIQTVVRYELP